jgi:hypothetical protein
MAADWRQVINHSSQLPRLKNMLWHFMATNLNIYELFLAALLLALRMIYLRNLINIKALL